MQEIKNIKRKLQNNKSSGENGIAAEMLKDWEDLLQKYKKKAIEISLSYLEDVKWYFMTIYYFMSPKYTFQYFSFQIIKIILLFFLFNLHNLESYVGQIMNLYLQWIKVLSKGLSGTNTQNEVQINLASVNNSMLVRNFLRENTKITIILLCPFPP